MLDVDKALMKLGKFGRYQLFVFNLGTATWTFCAMQMMSMAFTNTLPPFNCFPEEEANSSNFPGQCRSNVSGAGCFSANGTSAALYDPDFGRTIATEWSLLCSQRFFLELSTSLFMFGNLVGSFAIPPFADVFGRKWLLLASAWAMGATGGASALVSSYSAYSVLRFLCGFFYSGIACIGWVLSCEVIEPGLRAYATIGMGIWWTFGYVITGPIAMGLPNWRALTLATSLPVALTIAYIWLLPESPHWLVARDRSEAARAWFAKAAKINGLKQFSLEDCEMVETGDPKAPKSRRNILHICLSPVLVIQTLIMSYLWLCNTFVYYGLSLFSTELVGDRYVNFILSGVVELPAYFIVCPMMNSRLGRRWTIFIFHVIAGLALLSLTLIPANSGRLLHALSTALWLLGKSAITGTFASIFVFGAELFPTTLRTAGVGLCSTASKIGGVLAPYIRLLAEVEPRLPALVFGASSLLAAAATLALPETGRRKLPEDLADVRPGPLLGCLLRKK